MHRLYFLISLIIACAISAHAARVEFSAPGGKPVITLEVPASTGLAAVYVAPTTAGLTATYTPDKPGAPVTWHTFGPQGATAATQVATGLTIQINNADCGYFIEEDTRRTYFYLIDYSASPMTPGELTVTDADCSATLLTYTGSAPRLTYTTVNGRQIEIDRGITLSYLNLTPPEAPADSTADIEQFTQINETRTLASITGLISIPPTLCTTHFTLQGDRFLTAWGNPLTAETSPLTPVAVQAATAAAQTHRTATNEQQASDTSFGGSAPVDMTFRAAVTDAAIFTEWQVATDPEFNDITLRQQSTDFDHTFTQTGTLYIRFNADNTDGTCPWYSDTYTVTIGESRLRCPNAFSPGATEGVNDEWRVSYRSIVQFECHIFNRLGVLMTQFNDPALGWDGKYKGKPVPPGVYYYVIKATGADGKQYSLSGDINILRPN